MHICLSFIQCNLPFGSLQCFHFSFHVCSRKAKYWFWYYVGSRRGFMGPLVRPFILLVVVKLRFQLSLFARSAAWLGAIHKLRTAWQSSNPLLLYCHNKFKWDFLLPPPPSRKWFTSIYQRVQQCFCSGILVSDILVHSFILPGRHLDNLPLE